MTTLDEVVSRNVRLMTMARGTTPTAIARELGRSHQWIQAKIAGRNRWTVGDLEEVADVLHVRPGELVDDVWSLELVKRPRQDSNLQPTDLGLAA